MKEFVVLLFGFVNSVSSSFAATQTTTGTSCTDRGVWLLDGIVSCEYLEKPSGYGIHNNPEGFCQKHHTECCRTCTRLEKKGFTVIAQPSTSSVISTPVASKSAIYKDITTSFTSIKPCIDSGVWLVDGIVSCEYLEKPSGYGIHNNPEGFCQKHHTECCKTCTRLQKKGYSVIPENPTSSATSQDTTAARTTARPCSDHGVWLMDGIISCDYLEKPSGYGIHNNPESFCQKYEEGCCVTCKRLRQNGYTTSFKSTPSVLSIVKTTKGVESTGLKCTDNGIWIGDGIVSCSYLETPSGYGIHNNPVGVCQQHFNECCITCTRLRQEKSRTLGKVESTLTTSKTFTSKPASTTSTKQSSVKTTVEIKNTSADSQISRTSTKNLSQTSSIIRPTTYSLISDTGIRVIKSNSLMDHIINTQGTKKNRHQPCLFCKIKVLNNGK